MPRMPTIPTAAALGDPRVNGRATPAEINPNVAYDIGRAGAAWARAFDEVAGAFASFGVKKQAAEDKTWLAEAKIATLEADDEIRRSTELAAGPDGTGYEQAPIRFKGAVEDIEKRPGGSAEARAEYKLWSAGQGYQTGAWAANTAQKKMQGHTLGILDRRLETLSSLAASNPERAEEYRLAYEEEVKGYAGVSITQEDAAMRIAQARSKIGKSALLSKAIKYPASFGRVLKALEDPVKKPTSFTDYARGKGVSAPASASEEFKQSTGPTEGAYSDPDIDIVNKIDPGARYGRAATRNAKPFEGVVIHHTGGAANLESMVKYGQSVDKERGGSFGYHFYIDRDGTIYQGAPMDKRTNHIKDPSHGNRKEDHGNLTNSNAIGISLIAPSAGRETPEQIAAAQKLVGSLSRQYNIGAGNVVGHGDLQSDREEGEGQAVLRAIKGGDPVLLEKPNVTEAVDLSKLPKVAGPIQPSEIMALSGEDRDAVMRGMKPYIIEELNGRMENALASIAAKGTQDVISEEEISDFEPFIGPKTAAKWREALAEAREQYVITKAVSSMTPEERQAKFRELVPTGRPEDLAGIERTRWEMWAKASKAHDDAIAKAPLDYLSVNNESGRQAAQTIASAPTGEAGLPAREQAYATLLRLQRQEGVPAWKQRILGEKEAARIAGELADSTAPMRSTKAINDIRATYGRHADRAWGELVDAGAPAYLLSLTTATRVGQDDLLRSMAMEKAATESAGKDRANILLEKAGITKAELERAVTDRISPFTDSLRTGRFGGERLIESYRAAVGRTALYYMIVSGKSVGDAVNAAANEIYNKSIVMVNGVNVPADTMAKYGSELEKPLNSNVSKIISTIDLSQTLNYIDIKTDKRFGPTYADTRYKDETVAYGKLFMNAEGTGVHVMDNSGVPLADLNGKEISIPWETIIEIGKTDPTLAERKKRRMGY